MRCIFCKNPSNSSISVEHIVPESLGNLSHTLPPGVVCDSCNNYFASKIEKPVLDSPRYQILRGYQEIPNKRKRFPVVPGLASPGVKVEMHRERKTGTPHFVIPIDDDPNATDKFMLNLEQRGKGVLYLPTDGAPPPANVFSRFLAMMALEAIALRLLESDGGLEYIVTEEQFDPVRHHARRGSTKNWPFSERRIYPSEPIDGSNQIMHEFDILVTPENEWYFVIAILGVEFALNIGGPELDGYEQWLANNGGASPLYSGKNAT